MKTFLVNLTLFLFIAVSVFVPEPSATEHKDNIDQKATERLKQMSDYLGDVKQFTVNTQNTLEDLLESGHRVDLDVFAKVIISRPNKIRAERRGDLVDQIFYYNGKTMTLFNPSQNVYSTEEAPDTYHGLFKFLYESLGFGIPISDLILNDTYTLLMQDVTLAQVIGKTYLDGVKCDHLLFSRPGVTFQVWVREGSIPLPMKYVVTDTATSERLSISARMNDWNVEPMIDDSQFTFVQPEGAQEIKFILF